MRWLSIGSRHALLLIVLIVSIGPLLILANAALKSNAELAVNPLGLPQDWRFSNFPEAFLTARMDRFLINSVLVVVPTLAIVLAVASAAGYGLAKFDFPGRRPLLGVCLAALTIPVISVVVPLFYLMRDIHLEDSLTGLILAEATQALPLAIFVLRASFMDLPSELREAALVDGAGEFRAFFAVMLPLAKSGVAAAGVLTFLATWNDFLLPLVLINTESLRTLPLGLAYLQGRYVTDIPHLAAATLLTALPSVLIYLLLQRQFARGVVAGAIK